MTLEQRRKLIAEIVKKNQSKRGRLSEERDTGIALAPTVDDVTDELTNMSGFREELRDRANITDDEMLYGSSRLNDGDDVDQ